MGVFSRLKHAWNAFGSQAFSNPTESYASGSGYGIRPDRRRTTYSNERSIISSIYTRLSVDIAGIVMRHVRLDDQDRYLEDMDSGLNTCLTVEANLDQGARQFRQDIAKTLIENGTIAIVPIDTDIDPAVSAAFDIKTMRVGEITAWFPRHVRVRLYNDDPEKGVQEEVTLEKKFVAIVENPFYSVMNEPNSTLQRLIRKINLLDVVDEQSSSGKLDMIIQLPYVIKSEARRQQAEQRRKDIEFQLKGSQYGIAYTDGTEKITQLNRPAENNLLGQIEYLTKMLYSQLGLTDEILNGTADEKTMVNYFSRTIDPFLDAITEAMIRAFLTKTARTQKQTILYFRDPFKLVPVETIAEIADKFARNEILTSNELRGVIGFKPSKDPKADKLINSNMPTEKAVVPPQPPQNNQPPAPSGPQPPQLAKVGGDGQNGT
jgi:hypothetical protein